MCHCLGVFLSPLVLDRSGNSDLSVAQKRGWIVGGSAAKNSPFVVVEGAGHNVCSFWRPSELTAFVGEADESREVQSSCNDGL